MKQSRRIFQVYCHCWRCSGFDSKILFSLASAVVRESALIWGWWWVWWLCRGEFIVEKGQASGEQEQSRNLDLNPLMYKMRHFATCTCLHIRQVLLGPPAPSGPGSRGRRRTGGACSDKGCSRVSGVATRYSCGASKLKRPLRIWCMRQVRGPTTAWKVWACGSLVAPVLTQAGRGYKKAARVFRGIRHQRGDGGRSGLAAAVRDRWD